MLDRKYDNAVTEGMAHCARDPQIQNALADQTPDCIIVLRDRAMAYTRRFAAFSEESEAVQRQAAKLIADGLLRFGPIAELIWNPEVIEIMVNAADNVWVECRECRGRIKPVDVQFHDEEHILRTIERIVSPDGCRCDNRNPQIDCTLHRDGAPFDGARVSAMTTDDDRHWVLNIRKRSNDKDINALSQNIDYDSWKENLANYYRSELFARMGISDGCPDKIILPRSR